MKTIIYATDCRKKSSKALKYAYDLSLALNAHLHIIHTYDLFPIITANVRARSVLEINFFDEQYLQLRKYCNKHLEENFDKTKISYHLVENESISNAVLSLANKINADLIIVGTKSLKLLRIFSSNIADHIMVEADCPVLILPDELHYNGLSKLLYATDFEEADIHAIRELVEFAEPYGAEIKVIHIPRQGELYYKQKMTWFKHMVSQHIDYPEIRFSTQQSEDVESGIHEYIQKEIPEILVMMERQKESFIKRLFHVDMVKTMEGEISIPLLVYNKKSIRTRLSEQFDRAGLLSCV